METVCLICCRGGSKGLPKKNIRMFHGKPMLAWTIEAAIDSKIFDTIILSTDCNEIADVGALYGAEIPELRPKYLAQDDSDQFDVHSYIFKNLKMCDDQHIVCVLNNNPFITAKILQDSYMLYGQHKSKMLVVDSILVPGDVVHWKQCSMENGVLKLIFQDMFEQSSINRQCIKPTYANIFNVKWGWPSVLESYEKFKKHIKINGVIPYMLPKLMNFDIDDIHDFKIAEAVFDRL